jgi:hypothetical protein
MVINHQRNPELSLYYIGGIILEILKANDNELELDSLHQESKSRLKSGLSIEYFYLALDWLFLVTDLRIEGTLIYLCI